MSFSSSLVVNKTYLFCKAFAQTAQERQEYRAGQDFTQRASWCFAHTVLQEKKEAIASGKRQTENTLKEGNDILDEANRLADEINSVIDVSIC